MSLMCIKKQKEGIRVEAVMGQLRGTPPLDTSCKEHYSPLPPTFYCENFVKIQSF